MRPPIAQAPSAAPAVGIDRTIVGFGSGLASIAFTCWLLAHVPALAPVAIPALVVMGLALGFLVPWMGLLLTIAIAPFLGGAVDPLAGEVLRVIPIYGAAARVLLDRFVLWPRMGRPRLAGPPWWAVAAAVAAMARAADSPSWRRPARRCWRCCRSATCDSMSMCCRTGPTGSGPPAAPRSSPAPQRSV